MQRALNELRPQLSTDPTLVRFSISGNEFTFPRSEIATMSRWPGGAQELVTIRLDFTSELQDLGLEQKCFEAGQSPSSPDCKILTVILERQGEYSNADRFRNLLNANSSLNRDADASGFEVYRRNSDGMRTVFYYKKNVNFEDFLLKCDYYDSSANVKGMGTCDTVLPLKSDVVCFFFLNSDFVPRAIELFPMIRHRILNRGKVVEAPPKSEPPEQGSLEQKSQEDMQ